MTQLRTLSLGIFIGIGIGFFLASLTLHPDTKPLENLGALIQPPKPITISGDQLSVTVHGVRYDNTGAGPLLPSDGNRFVIVDLTIDNGSDAVLPVIPMFNLYLKDEEGRTFPAVAVPTASNPKSGDLAVHDRLRQEIGFDTSKSSKWLRLYYEPGSPGHSPLVVDLTHFLPK